MSKRKNTKQDFSLQTEEIEIIHPTVPAGSERSAIGYCLEITPEMKCFPRPLLDCTVEELKSALAVKTRDNVNGFNKVAQSTNQNKENSSNKRKLDDAATIESPKKAKTCNENKSNSDILSKFYLTCANIGTRLEDAIKNKDQLAIDAIVSKLDEILAYKAPIQPSLSVSAPTTETASTKAKTEATQI